MGLRVSMYTDVPSRQPLSKPAIQIGDNHASTSPTTINDSHAHDSQSRWPPRPILVCDRLRHGASADAPTMGVSSSQPLIEVSSDVTSRLRPGSFAAYPRPTLHRCRSGTHLEPHSHARQVALAFRPRCVETNNGTKRSTTMRHD